MKATLKIQNLKCGGCVATITSKLNSLEGILDTKVIVEENLIHFDYTNESTLQNAKEALKSIGYPEEGKENSLGTKAKSYVSCAVGKMKS
jgi:copper chaperone